LRTRLGSRWRIPRTVAPLTDEVGGILDAVREILDTAAGIPEVVVKTNVVVNTNQVGE
jgi:hypothetical protein